LTRSLLQSTSAKFSGASTAIDFAGYKSKLKFTAAGVEGLQVRLVVWTPRVFFYILCVTEIVREPHASYLQLQSTSFAKEEERRVGKQRATFCVRHSLNYRWAL
jgi:hypothetical protein